MNGDRLMIAEHRAAQLQALLQQVRNAHAPMPDNGMCFSCDIPAPCDEAQHIDKSGLLEEQQ